MNRKKLANNEKFVFNETEFVNPRGNRTLPERSSIQKRLFPKTEAIKPAPNPSSNADGIGPSNPSIIKKDPTTDPYVEEVVAKLAMLKTESLRITVNVNDDAQSRRIQMLPTNPCPPVNSKKVLLQVVPKSTSKVLHPFKADNKKTDVTINNNSIQNNNKPKLTCNENATAIKPSPHNWKAPVMFKRGSTLSSPASQEPISVSNSLQNDQPDADSCCTPRRTY